MTSLRHRSLQLFRAPGQAAWSPALFAEMLDLSEPDLAIALEIPESVMRLQPDDASVQKKLGFLANLFDRLLELSPDAATAARHIKNIPIRVLANRTLLEAVRDNESEKALRYLKSISGGQSG